MHIFLKFYNQLLRKSEKYTKVNMVYLAQGGFWLTLANIVSSALIFFMAVVFASQLSSENYGVYRFVVSVLSILSISTLSGIGPVLAQAVSRGREGSFFRVLKAKIAWGMIGAVGAFFLSVYYYFLNNSELAISFLLVALFVPFMDSFAVYQDYLFGRKLFKQASLYFNATQIFVTTALIASALIIDNVFVILIVHLFSWTLLRLFYLIYTVRKFPPNREVDTETVSYGVHLSSTNVLVAIANSIDQVLIFNFLGAIPVAIYSFAVVPATQITHVFRNIQIIAIPKLSHKTVQEINKSLYQKLTVTFIVGIVVTGVYILLAPTLYRIFFPQYLDSILFSQIFALTLVLAIPQIVLSSFIFSKITDLPKMMIQLLNIPCIVSIVFIIFSIGTWGLMSVIAARLIFTTLYFIISFGIWRYLVVKNNIGHLNPIFAE